MKKVVTLYPEKENIPMSKRKLRVATYCRISTEHEEQDGSIELQEDYFRAVMNTPGANRQFDRASPTPFPLKSYTLSAGPTPSV
jgi:hypothetical protein